jgi:CubicO group peptidase (beta-lactamase class C family)
VGLLVVLGFIGLVAYVLFRQDAYSKMPDTADLAVKVRAEGEKYIASRKNAALIIAVYQRGNRLIEGFGITNEKDPREPDERTFFEIGSVTKVFTGIALARLVEDGKISLEDSIAPALPEGITCPIRAGKPITFLELVTHTSGLPRLPENMKPANPANPYAGFTNADLFESLAKVRLGEGYAYSNYGFGLLGQLLSLKAGKPYAALVADSVTRPLVMNETSCSLSPLQKLRLASGHNRKGQVVPNWDMDAMAPAGALRSNARDMLRFVEANLNPSATPIGPALELAQEIHFDSFGEHVGLGWQVRRTVQGPVFIWHNGGTGGYASFVGFDREHQTGVIVLSSTGDAMVGDFSTDAIGMHLLELAPKISLGTQ